MNSARSSRNCGSGEDGCCPRTGEETDEAAVLSLLSGSTTHATSKLIRILQQIYLRKVESDPSFLRSLITPTKIEYSTMGTCDTTKHIQHNINSNIFCNCYGLTLTAERSAMDIYRYATHDNDGFNVYSEMHSDL